MMNYDDLKSLCESRRSIRYFDQKPVSKEDILKLLELGNLAPSVENLQPWHFEVVLNKELKQKLTNSSCYGDFVGGSAAFIVVTMDRNLFNKATEPVWNEKELEYSCAIAMNNILLGATALGIGSCWISLHHGGVHKILNIARDKTVIGGLMLGHYKEGEDQPSGRAHERHGLESTYTFHE